MEKLIELVYKYNEEKEGEKIGLITSVKEGECEIGFDKEKEIRKYENYIISKKFGFIGWLVENDKIDLDKLEKKVLKENLIRKFDEGLLMLLSISDTPIEDLISYLK